MVRHYCPHTEEMVLCIAESRGDEIDCDKCSFKEDKELKQLKQKEKRLNKTRRGTNEN